MNIFQQRQYDALRKKRDGNTAPQKMSTSNRAAAERAQAGIQRARAGAAGATESKAQTFREFSERQRMTDAPVRWYQDEQPTARETLARIYEIGRTSPRDGEKLYREYERFTGDASTPLYAPYTKATSKAFEALGLDADKGVDEAFFTQNAGLKNSYRTSATGTTPLGPTKSSTGGQDAAYWLYQMLEDEAPTKQAEAEWDGLQQELRYWAGRSDRNYSDGEIMARVDWEKYPTLRKMDEGQQKGVPLSLNRPVAYSKDAMVGVLWAARNPNEATGDPMTDAVQGALGRGQAYQRDEQTAARLDPTSPSYAPYTVGSTMDAETQLLGTDGFDQQWLDDNYGAVMAGGDEGAIKAYGRVYEAEKQTQAAEKDAADLNAAIERRIANGEKPEDIFTEEFLDLYPELQKMQDALQKGQPLALTRAVDFDLNSAYQKAQAAYDKRTGTVSGEAYSQSVSAALAAPVSTPSTAEAVNAERNQNLDTVRGTLAETGTPEEQRLLHTGGGASFAPTASQVRDSIQRGAGGVTEMQDSLYAAADKYATERFFGAREAADAAQLDTLDLSEPAQAFLAAYMPETLESGKLPSTEEVWARAATLEDWQQESFTAAWSQVADEVQGAAMVNADTAAAAREAEKVLDEVRARYRDVDRKAPGGRGMQTLAALDYAYTFRDYEATNWSALDVWDAALTQEGADANAVAGGMAARRAQNAKESMRLESALKTCRGLNVPDTYLHNMERRLAVLEDENADIETHRLRENADFDEKVAAFDAEQEGYHNRFNGFKVADRKDLIRWAIIAGSEDEVRQIATLSNLPIAFSGFDPNYTMEMTEAERGDYKYLYMTKGAEEATAYYDRLEDRLKVRKAESIEQSAREIGQNAPMAASVASIPFSLLRIAGTISSGISLVKGEEINPHDTAFTVGRISEKMREGTKQSFSDAVGGDETAVGIFNFVYDGLMSAGDSTMSALVGGAAGGAALMSLGATSNAIMDAKLRGADDWQATLYGAATGVVEFATEKLPMENLAGAFADGGAKGVRGLLSRMLTSVVEEAPGESLSEWAGGIADDLIMKEMSNRNAAIAAYQEHGLSRAEAERQADKDILGNILYAGLQGGFSGAVSSGTSYAAGWLSSENKGQSGTNTGAPDGTKARAVTALAQAEISGVGAGGQTATLAGALGAMSGQEAAATAAAQSLMESAPEAALATARQIVLASDDSDTVSALQFAAIMPESDSGKLLADMQETGVTPEKVEAMTDAAVRELGDPVMNGNYHNAVANSIEAVETMNQLMNDAHQEVERKKAEAKKARAEWTKVKNELTEANQQASAAEGAFVRANDAFQQNMSDPALAHEAEKAIERLNKARQEVDSLRRKVDDANKAYLLSEREWKKASQSEVNKARTLAQESSFGQNYRELGYANLSNASSFAEAVQAWEGLNGAVKTNLDVPFVMGRTTPLLQSYGAPDADIAMLSSKLTAIQKKHPEMSADMLAKLPEIVQNPVLITKSKTVSDRLVLFGTVYTDEGTPIVAVLSLNGEKNRVQNVDFIKMHSAYGKDTDAQAFIDASEVLYVDKNRSHEWELSTGLQLLFDASGDSAAVRPNQTGGIVTDSFFTGSDNSIAQTDEKMQASEALERMASGKHSEFVQSVQTAAGEYGDFIDGGVKSVSSMQAKVERKRASGQAQYAAGDMKDHVRGAIMLKNGLNDVPAVVEALKKQFPALTGEAFLERPLNRTGYRGIHLVAELGDGINGEIQLTTPEAWAIKKQTDKYYQKWRDIKPKDMTPNQIAERERDYTENARLWQEYYDGITPDVIRMASSSVMGLESKRSPQVPENGTQSESLNSLASSANVPALQENNRLPSRENSNAFNDTTSIPIIPDFPGENNDGESDKASPEASFVDATGMEQVDGEAQAAGQKDGAQLDTEAGQRDNQEGAYTPDRIEAFAKAGGVEKLAMPPQEIYRFTQGRRDLSESLLLAIPEAYGDEGLSVKERAEKYRLPERPEKASLSTYQTRIWYRWQENRIRERLDYSKPLEDVARQAFEMRNEIRTTAREAMADTVWAEYLREKEKNKTWEGVVEYKKSNKLSGDALWQSIIESSMRSRDKVNRLFALKDENEIDK